MRYENTRTGLIVNSHNLTEEEERFYEKAKQAFERDMDWLAFENFAFGPSSPIYKGKGSDLDVTREPLYRVLADLWIELGIRQERVAPERTEKKRATRRKEKGRGKAANRGNRKKKYPSGEPHLGSRC